MKKFGVSIALSALLTTSGATQAAIITQQFSVTSIISDSFNSYKSIFFNPFDTSNGVLQGVKLVIDGVWSGDATVTNPFVFDIDAYLLDRSYVSYGPSPFFSEPLLEFIHPVTIRMAAGSQAVLHGSQTAEWILDFNSVKDNFIGTVQLEYQLNVGHSQGESSFYDLRGQLLRGSDGMRYPVVLSEVTHYIKQDVTVTYTYCPSGQNCASNIPEPSILALFGLGLAGLGSMRRLSKRGVIALKS